MEPQLPQVNIQPEAQPVSSPIPEQPAHSQNTTPEALVKSPEVATSAESSALDNYDLVVSSTMSDDSQDDTAVQPQQAQTDNDVDPTTAIDGDIIEKEWVAKAKMLVSETVSDPHKQQDQVSKLMADYVLKRYGRKIGEDNG